MKNRLYTISQVHRATDLNYNTIAHWFREGRVQGAFRIGRGTRGGRWYATADALIGCLKEHGWTGDEAQTVEALEQQRNAENKPKQRKEKSDDKAI